MKTIGGILAAAALLLAACGAAASGSSARTAADQHLCTAAKALKQHPGIVTSLTVIKDGKNATGPYRSDVVTFAGATIKGPKSAVTSAEQKLFADCGL